MRLTIQALGLELDITFGHAPTDGVEVEDQYDPGRDLGYTGGTFLSFTSAHPIPEEVPAPQHCPSWDEPEDR